MRKSGFTLVELLVVVAVLGILAMFLLPMLQGAVESGRTTVCANNEKQIHAAFMQYCDTNNNALPRATTGLWTGIWTNNKSWVYIMRDELSQAVVLNGNTDPVQPANHYRCIVGQFLTCPSAPLPAPPPNWLTTYSGSYGMNMFGIGSVFAFPGLQPRRYLRLTDVRYPSRQTAFGDTAGYGYPDMTVLSVGGWGYWPGQANRVAFPHNNNTRTNAVFVDGHVKTAGAEILKPESSALNGLFSSPPWGSP